MGALALVLALGALFPSLASAHAGPRQTDPADGATLGDTPTQITLTFSEKPESSLSEIAVRDTAGVAYQIGRPGALAADPLALSVRVRPLSRGVYIVSWRVVSAVDGHASAGTYAFGVLVAPTAIAAASTTPVTSPFEVFARAVLLTGLVVLLGAATAGAARFDGGRGLFLGGAGIVVSGAGVALLAYAQRQAAATSLADLLSTPVGRALVWRAAGIGAAGIALAVAEWWGPESPRLGRGARVAAALAAAAAMAAHVGAGHAAAGGMWPPAATIAVQLGHLVAVAVWVGGLAALLIGVRGAPSAAKAAAVHRFSNIAAAALIVAAGTGVARALNELTAWGEVLSTGYGRTVLAKGALLGAMAFLGAANRLRSVPRALTTLAPLRLAGGGELVLAAVAVAAAALLGTLPPPAATRPLGLMASGADFGTTVRVRLTTGSGDPGPNRYTVFASDYDSNAPFPATRVSLAFEPLDDSDVEATSLTLNPGPDHSWVGSGANLSFDGRWKLTALIERAGGSVEIPMEIATRHKPQFVSIARRPGRPPTYTVEVEGRGHVRFSPDPERPGPSEVSIHCYDILRDERNIEAIVVTVSSQGGPEHQVPVRRASGSLAIAGVELRPGRNRVTAVARILGGTRLRATVDIDVGSGPWGIGAP